MNRLIEVTAASGKPVELDEALQYVKVGPEESTLLNRLIDSATEQYEGVTGLRLMAVTLDWRIDGFVDPASSSTKRLEFPVWPVQSLTAAEFKYTADVASPRAVAVDAALYDVVTSERPSFVRLKTEADKAWPGDSKTFDHAVNVRFVAGFASHEEIPQDHKTAVLEIVKTEFWRFRGDKNRATEREPWQIRNAKWRGGKTGIQ